MALIYSPSIANVFVYRGVVGAIDGIIQTGINISPSPTPTLAITVYSGAQPSAAGITASWSAYNTNFLFHQPGVTYILPNPTVPAAGALLTRNNLPTAVTAANTGTASWCIIWCSNVATGSGSGQISNAVLPNTKFIVGPVTTGSGNGIVTLASLSIVSGTSVSILDSTIKFKV